MISTGEVVIEGIAVAQGHGELLFELALGASRVVLGSDRVNLGSDRVGLGSDRVVLGSDRSNLSLNDPKLPLNDSKMTLNDPNPVSAVIAATFSNPDRFPSLAVRLASALSLPASTPAFDIQMACSAYPYALYVAGKLAADLGGKVLVVDGDVQSPLVDASDHATGGIFSDACTATVVSCRGASAAHSCFDFLSRHDEALSCTAQGPIKMDGFAVFSFVATEVSKFLSSFLDEAGKAGGFDARSLQFAPHQANPYMVRRLAEELGLKDRLLAIPDEIKNPGSCSIPMALAMKGRPGLAVVAGFGAGYSASAAVVRIAQGAFGGPAQ